VAINEQLPALPLPRTVKLSTRLLKRTVGPDANLIPTCALKKILPSSQFLLNFRKATPIPMDSAMAVDLFRNVRTFALMLLSPLIFIR